jgi:hypothetical protein
VLLLPLHCLEALCACTGNTSQVDAAAFSKAQGWGVDGGEAVLPLTAENTTRPKQVVGQDGIKYAEISGLIQTLSR